MSTLHLLLLLAEAGAASVALPVLAGLLAHAYPRSAGRRRLVWVTMFASLLALPLVAAYAPTLAVISLAAPPSGPATVMVPTADLAAAPSTVFSGTTGAIILALCAWALGAVWIVARSLIGLVWLQRLRVDSAPFPPEQLPLPLPRGCSVRLSPDCPGPMTWGAARPVILLPDDALDWPQRRLEAVLRHELAHVAGRDSLIQALALVACALYWPNPLVWRAARALRQEAEAAADDAVIAAGMRPSDYANLLVDMASAWPSHRRPAFEMAMAAPPILTERVQSILSPDAIRTGATAMDILKLVLLGGAATAALTLARPSVAEVPAPPSAPADPQTRQAAPAAPPANAAPSAPAGATTRSRVHDQVVQSTRGPGDKQTIQLAHQDVPARPAAAAQPAPPASPAPTAGAAAAWTMGWAPNPNGPPPSPGATAGATAPWILSWLPNPNGPLLPPEVRTNLPLTPEQRTEVTEIVRRRAELDRQLAPVGPAIEKAIADAHIDQTVQKALSDQDAKTREIVAKELAELGPRIQRQIANAHIQELNGHLQAEMQAAMQAAIQAQKAREPQPPQPPQPPKN
jgi:beta-lactamase regulating signal transducer with metallopeptidase domain